jgi:tripartite-type tricarboxylate transporter receptor subunit TctC
MSKRILVVEDQPDNRQIICDMLAPTDYEMAEAENGEQALAAVAKQRPDLILMDIQLPIIDGHTATSRIKADPALHADVLFDTVSALIGQVQAGSLKALAVTDKNRFPAMPDVPTVMESGVVPNYDVTSWYGVFGPPGIAPSVVAKLNETLNEIIADEKVREHLVAAGVVVKGSTAEEFGRLLTDESERWNAVREAAGIARQ